MKVLIKRFKNPPQNQLLNVGAGVLAGADSFSSGAGSGAD